MFTTNIDIMIATPMRMIQQPQKVPVVGQISSEILNRQASFNPVLSTRMSRKHKTKDHFFKNLN